MRFLNWDALVGAFEFSEAALPGSEGDEADAVVVAEHGLSLRMSALRGEQVGRRLYKTVRLEQRLAVPDDELIVVNRMNISGTPIATIREHALSLSLPVAATDLDNESSIRAMTLAVFGGQESNEVAPDRRLPASMRQALSESLGFAESAEAFIRTAPDDLDLIFASSEAEFGTFHINLLIGEGFLQDAAVHDFCGDLVAADFYDPHYQSTANYAVADAQSHARSSAYKLQYAHRWNKDHGLQYWRLRATIIANRLVFRVPILVPLGRGDFSNELNAIQRAIANRFHYRSRVFRPLVGPGPLTILGQSFAAELLKAALRNL